MVIIGLTGGIATGKSTVTNMLSDQGFAIIDADAIARQVVRPGEAAYKQLRTEFGPEYFDDENEGALIRDKLGKLVFSNPGKRKKLNAITHPAIRWVMIKQFLCDGDKELERLKLRDNLSEEDALSRINAQMPIEEKKKRGTILIDNNGTIDELKQQVDALAATLKASWTPLAFRIGIAVVIGTVSLALFRILRLI